jgi:hypothetical protein
MRLREHFPQDAVKPFMRKSLPYEIIAAVSAMLGALILVSVYYPVLNPIQYEIDSHKDLPSVGYYIIMTPIPLAILWVSWKLNRKAQQLSERRSSRKTIRVMKFERPDWKRERAAGGRRGSAFGR